MGKRKKSGGTRVLLGLAGLVALSTLAVVRPVRRVAPMEQPAALGLTDERAADAPLRQRIPVSELPPDRAASESLADTRNDVPND